MNNLHDNTISIDKTKDIDNKEYVKKILIIIFLTNLPALATMLIDFKSSIGWITGSIASAVNFWFMAKNTFALNSDYTNANVKKTSKFFMIRFLFLISWSVLILSLLKPEIITYCVGLFSAQIAIVLFQFWSQLTNSRLNKYFRGKDE